MKIYFLLKMVDVTASYVSLPEGIQKQKHETRLIQKLQALMDSICWNLKRSDEHFFPWIPLRMFILKDMMDSKTEYNTKLQVSGKDATHPEIHPSCIHTPRKNKHKTGKV